MPWIHLHVGNAGKAKACCVSNIEYGDINTQTLEEIWSGDALQKVREKFLTGEPDKRCFNCIQREAAGAKSLRQETFEKFPNTKIEEKVTSPIYFDIRFSNVCNFRCRTCWHGASSKWFQDAKILGTNIAEKAIINNVDDFDAFIKKCGFALLNAEEFYFAGGEPLVTEQHYLLLNWLIANGATKARLRYNTNFSKLKFKDYDVLDLWSHFSEVEVMASIDAAEDLGEYIRKELDWNTFLQNREKIRASQHIKFKLSPTVSILNILHLPDLYELAIHQNLIAPEDLYLNILEYPGYYNIQILPPMQKEMVMKRYLLFFDWMETHKIPTSIQKSFRDVLNYMNQRTANSGKHQAQLWKKFLEQTSILDEMRGEKESGLREFFR